MSLIGLDDLIANRPPSDLNGRRFAAILGDQPSKYAKSPSIWNPTFQALGIDAVYIALDVLPGRVEQVIATLRNTPEFVGGNVTVPYKVEVMPFLDRLDPLAAAIGAVNTIARDKGGGLAGYNTDGQGAIDALLTAEPSQARPFIERLGGARVLMLGAGGAAYAVAFYLAREVGAGAQCWVTNRSTKKAVELVARLHAARLPGELVEIDQLDRVVGEVTLLVNATSVGQSGVCTLPSGEKTILEPYSPLAPVPVVTIPGSEPDAMRAWTATASQGIAENNRRSMDLLARLPASAWCFDLIYSPSETTLLRQGRLSGHATLNGRRMNICQAVAAFVTVMEDELRRHRLDRAEAYAKVLAVMSAAW